jgi:uncharacterized protein YutE (UPF0331/DUF86 family)
MPRDEVILAKVVIIERCVARARAEAGHAAPPEFEQAIEDSIVLNIQRGCEAAIDLAMHLVRSRALGIPQDRRDAFRLLVEAGMVDRSLGERLRRMVGFRNIAVHEYQRIARPIVDSIVASGLDDLLAFSRALLAL